MPCLKIFTNLSRSAVPKNFVSKILPVLSKCVNKPIGVFLVVISPDCILNVSEQEVPSIVASLESIGHLGPKENKVIASDLTAFMSKELGVEPNQIFLTFYDLAPHNVAKNGITIDQMS